MAEILIPKGSHNKTQGRRGRTLVLIAQPQFINLCFRENSTQ